MADSSRATAVGAGLGAANDGLPPLRPAAHQGFVRSLGWLALPHPWDALITSISASLGEQLRLQPWACQIWIAQLIAPLIAPLIAQLIALPS